MNDSVLHNGVGFNWIRFVMYLGSYKMFEWNGKCWRCGCVGGN